MASLFVNVPLIGTVHPYDLAVTVVLARFLFRPILLRRSGVLWTRFALLLPVWSIGLTSGSQDWLSGVIRLIHVGLYSSLIVSFPALMRSMRRPQWLFQAYSILLGLQVAFQLYQFSALGMKRAFGTVGSPLAPLLAAGIILDAQPFKSNLIRILWRAVLLVGLILTGSRSEWLVVIIAHVVMFAYRALKLNTVLALAAAVIVVASGVYFIMPDLAQQFIYRIGTASLTSGTGYIRIQSWRAAMECFVEHPVIGVGARGFTSPDVGIDLKTPHSLFLMLAAESGLIGIAIWLAFIAQVIKQGLACLGGEEEFVKRVGAYLITEIGYSFVGGTSFWGPYGVLFFSALGMLTYCYSYPCRTRATGS